MKEKALKLMASKEHAVISTLSLDNQPQSALVGFSEDDSLGLVIGTYKTSRKHKNIIANPLVSVVIADEDEKIEVQYEGKAQIIDADKLGDRLRLHLHKLPSAEKRLNDPNQAWIKITPTWVRFVDLSKGFEFEEMSF